MQIRRFSTQTWSPQEKARRKEREKKKTLILPEQRFLADIFNTKTSYCDVLHSINHTYDHLGHCHNLAGIERAHF
jgi:uncharacterized ferritin-like protein (DUF455 family)